MHRYPSAIAVVEVRGSMIPRVVTIIADVDYYRAFLVMVNHINILFDLR
jgi:hypothetical protein